MHPFGRESELCQREELNRQAANINEFFKSIDFSPLKGLKPHQKDLIVNAEFRKETNLHLVTELGHESRLRKRKEKRESDAKLAAQIMALLDDQIKIKKRSSEKSSTLEEELEKSKYPIGDHWQEIIAKHGDSTNFWRIFPKKQRQLKLAFDTSPFNDNTLSDLLALEDLRSDWLVFLKKHHLHEELQNCDARIASILVTSALFGGIVTQERLNALILCLSNNVYRTPDGLMYIELQGDESGKQQNTDRWIPDRLSEALILGLTRRLKRSKENTPTEQDVTHRLTEILSNLDIKTSKDRCISRLAKIARVSALIDYPAYLSGCLLGYTGTQISHDAWVRLTTEQIPQPKAQTLYEADMGDWLPLLSSKAPLIKHLKPIKQTIHKILVDSSKDSAKAKTIAIDKLKKLSNKYPDAPDISHLVIGWAISLCRKGTIKSGTRVKLSTINVYVMLVANTLFSIKGAMEFLDLTDIEYEDLYTNAVDRATQENQSTLVIQLQIFHAWVVEHYDDVEDCSFSPVWAISSKVKAKVSANIISNLEYMRALALVDSDDTLSDRLSIQYKSILIILRKFGLRFGEAYQLRKIDIQYFDDWSYAVVQINRIGGRRVKSDRGVRQVILLESLSTFEISVLRTLMSEKFLDDNESPITSISASDTERIPKNKASTYLNTAIKLVTNDNTASLKHLRHGYCSHAHAKIAHERYGNAINHKTQPWIDRKIDLENLTAQTLDKPFKALSLSLGHSSISTTTHSYLHSPDIYMHPGDTPNLINEFSAKALASILGESFDAYRKRKVSAIESISYAGNSLNFNSHNTNVQFIDYSRDEALIRLKSSKDEEITPSIVAEIFFYILSRHPNESFSHQAFNISGKQFWEICNIGDRLENDTNFDDYILANTDTHSKDRILPGIHPNIAQHDRIRIFLKDNDDELLQIHKENRALLDELDEIWCNAIHPKKYKLKINLESRFSTLKNFIQRFNIKLKGSIAIEDTKPNSARQRESVKSKRMKSRPAYKYDLDFKHLLRSNGASINCEADLHKVIFIVIVWFRFHN